ncbi:transposable element Tc3 transposase [Trichonephila clavipes]|nr:transposable element Tc3 transposase [Trichonephila clavipes]
MPKTTVAFVIKMWKVRDDCWRVLRPKKQTKLRDRDQRVLSKDILKTLYQTNNSHTPGVPISIRKCCYVNFIHKKAHLLGFHGRFVTHKSLIINSQHIARLSDEAHFWLNGYINKQNSRIWWSEANPQVHVETPLHPEKLTVWCALWAGGIIGPYFFKNDEGHNVTVNGDRYRAMITNFFIPELNNHDVQELWFQQDGATCHTARPTIERHVW